MNTILLINYTNILIELNNNHNCLITIIIYFNKNMKIFNFFFLLKLLAKTIKPSPTIILTLQRSYDNKHTERKKIITIK